MLELGFKEGEEIRIRLLFAFLFLIPIFCSHSLAQELPSRAQAIEETLVNLTNQAYQVKPSENNPGTLVESLFRTISVSLGKEKKEKLYKKINGEIHADSVSKVYYNSIIGNSNQSFLTPGTNYFEELIVSYKGKISDIYEVEGLANTWFTDDPRVDRRNAHMQKLFLRFTKPKEYEVKFGDVYSNFSQYSLGRSLEGFDAWYNFLPFSKDGGKIKANAVLARQYRAIHPNRYTRYVNGIRVETSNNAENKILGVNAVYTRDGTSTLESTGLNIAAMDNWLYSADLGLRNLRFGIIENVEIRSEIANSRNNPNIKDPSGTPKSDWAGKIDFSSNIKKLSLSASYERVNPNFVSGSGSAAVDQNLWRVDGRYRFHPRFSLRASFTKYNNNLKHLLATTTRTNTPTVSLDAIPFAKIPNLSLNFGYRRTNRVTTDDLIRNDRQTSTGSINYSIGKLSIGYTKDYTWVIDKINLAGNARLRSHSFNASLRDLKIIPRIKLTPFYSYSYQAETMFGPKRKDTTNNSRFGFNSSLGDDFVFNCSYGVTENDRMVVMGDSSSENLSVEVKFNPKNNPDFSVSMRYLDRNNNYDDTQINYEERTGEFEVRYRY